MKRPRRRWGLIATGVVAGLAAGAPFATQVVVDRAVRAGLASLSRRIGRTVSVRSVSIAWRPFAELRLEGVALAPARGSAGPAPVTAGAVRVHLDGLEALRSRGRHIVVDEVAVERPSVALRLLPGGHHDLEDVVAALRAHPLERSSREVHVRRVSVSGGALRVSDEVDAGRAPALLALANLQSRIDEPAARRVTVPVAASLEVWGATPTQEGSVAVRVTVDQTQREVALDGLALRLGSTEIDGSVDVAGLPEQPRLRALALTSRGATLDALLPLFPGVHPPSGSLLRGPVSLRATAAGDAVQGLDVDMSVDAAGATVIVPEWLHKPAGTPFAAAFRGRLRADDVAIARAGVTVGPLSVNLHGDVRSARSFDLAWDSGDVALDPLLRLVPAIRREVPAGTALHGLARTGGTLRTDGDEHTLRAHATLQGADVHVGDAVVTGAATLTFSGLARGRAVHFHGGFDASAARVTIPGRIDKAPGAPLRVDVTASHDGVEVAVPMLSVTMPGATFTADGTWRGRSHEASFRVHDATVDLAALATALPALRGHVPPALAGSTVAFSAAFAGTPSYLAAARAHVELRALQAPFARLHGTVDATGLDALRRLRFELWGGVVDLDLLGAEGASTPARGEAPSWHDADIAGTFRADAVRARGVTLTTPSVDVALQHGRLDVHTASFRFGGGAVRADGTSVDLTGPQHASMVALRAEGVDAGALADAFGVEAARRPSGTLGGEARFAVAGDTPASMRASATGTVVVHGVDVVARQFEAPTVTLVLPVLGERTVHPRSGGAPRDPLLLRSVQVSLAVDRGVVRTREPARIRTDEGDLTLAGSVAGDGALAFAGTVRLTPAAIEAATHGDRVVTEPVPVSFRVSGTGASPHVELVDVGATLRALAGSRLRAIGRSMRRALDGR